jgi:hypothetical protein
MLKIFKVGRVSYPKYDEMKEIIVVAENEDKARFMASQNAGDEGNQFWLDKVESFCIEITPDYEGVVCRNFNNG